MIPVRVLALTRFGVLGASSRLRFFQYSAAFDHAGVKMQVQALFDDVALSDRYALGHYRAAALIGYYAKRLQALAQRRTFDLVWIEKEALPWMPLWTELSLLSGVPFVLDYDDAVFHNYDQHRLNIVRSIFGNRLDGLMAHAALVVCGNAYLAERARNAGARWVEVLPTVIDLARYPKPAFEDCGMNDEVPRIVWIGSPTTAKYLTLLGQPLQALAARMSFVLRVIGAEVAIPGVQVECIKWSEATEVGSISECAVGVMPLFDSIWERGKCGYKLIQYMACGLPVVASDVGVNGEIVQIGLNGFLAREANDWVDALGRLLSDKKLRQHMGQSGRKRVEDEYSIQITGPKLALWQKQAAVKH